MQRFQRRGMLAIALAAMAAPLAAARAAPDVDAARAFISDLGQRAVDVLAKKDLSEADQQKALYGLLNEGFDLPMLARLATGRTWRSMTPEQQAAFQKVFDTYILETYSQRLSTYSGEKLRVDKAQPVSDADVMVQATVLSQTYAPWRMDWRVRDTGGGQFKIVDVLIEGVSMIVTQRNEFASVVQAQGVDGLTQMLRDRIVQAGGSPPA